MKKTSWNKGTGLSAVLTKEILEKLYFGEDLSITEIAEKYGVFRTSIQYHMCRLGVKGKPLNGSLTGRKPWNKGLTKNTNRWVARSVRVGDKHWKWKGGSIDGGYKRISIDSKRNTEHRKVMENHLGRKLQTEEVVHHVNHDRLDNRIENLLVMTPQEHGRLHRLEQLLK